MKYMEDSKKLISQNLQSMESIYHSDFSPSKQSVVVKMIKENMVAISQEMARITVLGVEHMKS